MHLKAGEQRVRHHWEVRLRRRETSDEAPKTEYNTFTAVNPACTFSPPILTAFKGMGRGPRSYLDTLQLEIIAFPSSPFAFAPDMTKDIIRIYSIDLRSCGRPVPPLPEQPTRCGHQ